MVEKDTHTGRAGRTRRIALVVAGAACALCVALLLLMVRAGGAPTQEAAEQPSEEAQASEPVVMDAPAEPAKPEPAGWVEGDDGVRRYYDPKTHELVGWWTKKGEERYFIDGTSEKPRKGWLELEGKRYWLKSEDGAMAHHEWCEVDGVWEVFDDDGAWIEGEDMTPPDDAQNMESMSERQRAVVEACDTTPWQGKGWCAAWVWLVFVNAGEPAGGGDACDIANLYCTSDDLMELKPGMVVAVPSHPQSENGKIWGHVCIYVGKGMVMDNGGTSVRTMRLGSWAAWFGATHPAKWGWNSGVSLE